jgi:hypothetical protein
METRVDVLVEPLSLLMSELTEIASRIENVHKSHSERVEAAAGQLRELLTEQITRELRQRLDCEFQEAAAVMRAEHEDRMRAAKADWASERNALQSEITVLRKNADRELTTEITQSEAALDQVRVSIHTMVNDPSVAISKLVRANAREGELAAYLKGLKFKADKVDAPTLGYGEVVAAGD